MNDKFMPEMHLKQPGFIYSACEAFTKNKERIQKFKEAGDTAYIYKNKLDKACFHHNMAYGNVKVIATRTASDNVLRDKAFNIAKTPKYNGYQRGIASMVYKFFDIKSTLLIDKSASGNGVNIPLEFNEQLAKELRKPIIRKFREKKVYSGFKDNICGADLADMQLIRKFNKGFRFLLCAIDIFSKYARAVALKDKKGVSIVDAFQKLLKESNRKPNKIWVDKGSEFYNSSFKKWLKDNDIEIYSIHNE